MKWYIDTEFNAFKGGLISLAMIREDAAVSMYAVMPVAPSHVIAQWVAHNVIPVLYKQPSNIPAIHTTPGLLGGIIESFLKGDPDPLIISDWPDDLKHFADAIVTGPGQMIAIPKLKMEVVRVDAYPTKLEGAIQHNAWWDAMALLVKCERIGSDGFPSAVGSPSTDAFNHMVKTLK